MANDANALSTRMFKLRKRLDEGLIDELEALSEDDLRTRLARCETNIHATEMALEADDDLKAKATAYKEAAASYNDAKKHQQDIARYCSCLLDQRGKL